MTPQEYFAADSVGGADFLELARHETAQTVLCNENAIILHTPQNGAVLFAARNETAAREAAVCLPRTGLLSAHGEHCVRAAIDVLGMKEDMRCYQARYLLPEPPAVPPGVEMHLLDERYVEAVAQHYRVVGNGSDWYARDRIAAGAMMGAFIDGALAGFIGVHSEGSMGMLEIFPEYRRRGLGYALEAGLIRHLMETGAIPYCHVIHDNEASLRLQQKLGLAFASGFVYWLS